MNRYYLLHVLLGLLLACSAGAATYKWVDKDGKVHYSDTPVEGAERVDLPSLPTYAAPVAPKQKSSKIQEDNADTGADDEGDASAYTSLAFISPKPDQVFWATGGKLPVQLDLKPALQKGDRIDLYLNGSKVESLTGLGTTLTEVYRGAHSLRAVVVGPDGAAKLSAESGTFYIKQQSIN